MYIIIYHYLTWVYHSALALCIVQTCAFCACYVTCDIACLLMLHIYGLHVYVEGVMMETVMMTRHACLCLGRLPGDRQQWAGLEKGRHACADRR